MATVPIPDNYAPIPYTATAGQTDFDFTWVIMDQAHVKVDHTVAATGIKTRLTLTTDYTVAGVKTAGGGTVSLVTGAAAGDTIELTRDSGIARLADFQHAAAIPADTLNDELDLLYLVLQEWEYRFTQMEAQLAAQGVTGLPLEFANEGGNIVLKVNGVRIAKADPALAALVGDFIEGTP